MCLLHGVGLEGGPATMVRLLITLTSSGLAQSQTPYLANTVL